jgi:hypothetical protein
MRVRAVDTNNDWTFGFGQQSYKTGLAALQQQIQTRLQSWLGDCFFAPAEGVNWNNYLDIGTKQLLDIDICKIINTTGGVIKIISYESQILPNRKFALSVKISTIFGEAYIHEEFQ